MRLSPVAVVHGSLTIVVKETPIVSQPRAPGRRHHRVVPNSTETRRAKAPVRTSRRRPHSRTSPPRSTLGLSPREMASVLQALRAAGALEADVVVQ